MSAPTNTIIRMLLEIHKSLVDMCERLEAGTERMRRDFQRDRDARRRSCDSSDPAIDILEEHPDDWLFTDLDARLACELAEDR